MSPTWQQMAEWTGFAVFFLAVVVFGWRSRMRFWKRLKENRAAGIYADPEFKRRIRPLNILRYGFIGFQLALAALMVLLMLLRVWFDTLAYIWFALILITAVPALVVERRWNNLMMHGLR